MKVCNLELWTNNCTTLALVFTTSNYRTIYHSNYFDYVVSIDCLLSLDLPFSILLSLPLSVTGTKHIMCIRSCPSEKWSVLLSNHILCFLSYNVGLMAPSTSLRQLYELCWSSHLLSLLVGFCLFYNDLREFNATCCRKISDQEFFIVLTHI